MIDKKLYKDPDNKMLAGVCGGLGVYFHIDPTLIRLIYVLATFITGFVPCIVVYILAAIIMPNPPEENQD